MKLFETLTQIAAKEAEGGLLKRLITGPIIASRQGIHSAVHLIDGKSEDEMILELKSSSFIAPEK